MSGVTDEIEKIKPQALKTYKRSLRQFKKNKLKSTVEMIETYSKSRLTWAEAKPFVDFLEKTYGLCPPKNVKAAIGRINQHFSEKLYGKDIKAKTVVIKSAHFQSMNHITKNKHVNLGDEYERE